MLFLVCQEHFVFEVRCLVLVPAQYLSQKHKNYHDIKHDTYYKQNLASATPNLFIGWIIVAKETSSLYISPTVASVASLTDDRHVDLQLLIFHIVAGPKRVFLRFWPELLFILITTILDHKA